MSLKNLCLHDSTLYSKTYGHLLYKSCIDEHSNTAKYTEATDLKRGDSFNFSFLHSSLLNASVCTAQTSVYGTQPESLLIVIFITTRFMVNKSYSYDWWQLTLKHISEICSLVSNSARHWLMALKFGRLVRYGFSEDVEWLKFTSGLIQDGGRWPNSKWLDCCIRAADCSIALKFNVWVRYRPTIPKVRYSEDSLFE